MQEDFDNVFKEGLDNHFLEPDQAQLDDMEIRLEMLRYYKFGWRHFNIYYTAIIGLCFLLTMWTFIDRISNKSGKTTGISSVIPADTLRTDSIVVIKNTENHKTKNVKKYIRRESPVNPMAEDTSAKAPGAIASESAKDITTTISASPTEEKADSIVAPKITKPKKVIYIKKRDTIIQYDTTKVIRKK